MKKRKNRRRKKKAINRFKWVIVSNLGIACLVICAIAVSMFLREKKVQEKPEDLLIKYMNCVSKHKFEEMYHMIDLQKSENISKEDFKSRNSKIYEGIKMQNMQIENVKDEKGKDGTIIVTYETSFDTVAGKICFENEAHFVKGEKRYLLIWNDSMIFPDLESKDKVKVTTSEAKRGKILDRNGTILAGEGIASSVGIVPGKLEDKQTALEKIANLLDVNIEIIEKKLEAKWVKDDSFVPIKTLPKIEEVKMMTIESDEEILKEKEKKDQLLEIPGIMISDTKVREYPLNEAAAHLIGYVQSVTAKDLEEHEGEGYSSNSLIGRSGMEGLFEKDLKGQNGYEILIVDESGNTKTVLANLKKQDGKDVQLTIDANVQSLLYEQFKEDKSCSVAMNPYTGEILALVSTPAYDDNDFIMGMSEEEWTSLNEDEKKPLFNRFRQVWCPGSAFKPIIASIGLKTGAIDPNEDYGSEGTSWQKDATWGDYFVTTLHTYEPVVLENALIYSDNIYFAKAALKIGTKDLSNSLDQMGFNQEVPFEITLKKSQYSNTDKIESEVQLADSGYGQGQILVNPIHLASLYSAFNNNGNILKPYLLYRGEKNSEIWISQAFPSDVSNRILESLKKVVNNPNGTGYAAHRDGMVLAGKTGTAEIKASKEDTSGTELGWFCVFTTDKTMQNPILIVNMVEDVKDRGGSGYVVKKDKVALDHYLQKSE